MSTLKPFTFDGTLTESDLADLSARAVARDRDAEAENTRRSYRTGWRIFVAFCRHHDLRPLPARPQTVVRYIEWLATQDYTPQTIESRLTAIADRHRRNGEENPCRTQPVKRHLKNVRRTSSHQPDQKSPVLMEHLRAMAFDEDDLSDLRDRAVLFMGFAGGFRRQVLSSLRTKDLREVEGGRVIHVPKSKTDQAEGRTVQIPNQVPGLTPPPNDALDRWLRAAEIESGPLFRMVDRWGNVRDGALSGHSVYKIVRTWVETIGENPELYGAHSLRAGFATQAYLDGIGEHEAAQQTGHSDLSTFREYQRVHVVMDDHPLSRMGV
jgi:site-specific recombinase XerD